MSNQLYNVNVPTSVEPSTGFLANDRIVFKMNFPNRQLRPGSVRLNGCLALSKNDEAIVPGDLVTLNPNAGISAFISQVIVKMNGAIVETINEFGRYVALKNEAKYYQLDNACSTDSMLELMTYSNDAVLFSDFKNQIPSGSLLQVNVSDDAAEASQLPFSCDLDICLNHCLQAIPYSRCGECEINFILQANDKCGMVQGSNDPDVVLSYAIRNLELRFLTDPEVPVQGAIILGITDLVHTPTVLNKINALEYTASKAFDAVVCSFVRTSHISGNNNFIYDYLASEAIVEQIEALDVKVNNVDSVVKFMMRLQTTEILYNYLLAWQPYINAYDEIEVKRHGLTYNKLSTAEGNATATGFGVGMNFHGGVDSGNSVTFNVNLFNAPSSPYNVYIFSLGKLII
jgi:hypothetical protein